MPLSATETLRSTPRFAYAYTVNNLLITIPRYERWYDYSSPGSGVFGRYNIDTDIAQIFTGTTGTAGYHAAALGGKLYFCGARNGGYNGGAYTGYLDVIDSTSGIATNLTGYGTMSGPVISFGNDWIIAPNGRYHVPSNTRYALSGYTSVGKINSKLYLTANNQAHEIDVETGNVIATITMPVGTISCAAFSLNNKLYWHSNTSGIPLVGINADDDSSFAIAASPANYPFPGDLSSGQWVLGPDGYCYRLHDSNNLVIVDPSNGRWAMESLPVVRSERGNLAIYNNDIWIASGEPLSW